MLSFANPALLAALAAVALPIVLHMARRTYAKAHAFPSIRFVRPVAIPMQRKRTPRDWLLLMLRCALLAVLAIAAASPLWTAPDAARQPAVVLVDTSASMAWGERAESLPERIVNALEAEAADIEQVRLVLFDRELRAESTVGVTAAEISEATEAHPPRPFAFDARSALEAALRFFPESGGQLFVVSDFQASQWQPANLDSLPSTVSFVSIPVGDFGPNLALASARLRLDAQGKTLVTTLRNDSDQAVNASLQLWDDATLLTRVEPQLEPSSSRVIELDLPEGGSSIGRLQLLGDAPDGSEGLTWDNTYHVWLAPPPALPVDLWYAPEATPEKEREITYVARALQVPAQGDRPNFTLRPAQLAEPADILYLPGSLDTLPVDAYGELAKRLQAGATAVVTPGINPKRMLRLLRENQLLPADLRELPTRRVPGLDYLAPLPDGSPLVNIFDEASQKSLILNTIDDILPVNAPEGSRIWLETESGFPLLLEMPHGPGRLMLFLMHLDNEASTLPVSPAFLPIIRETFARGSASTNAITELSIGDAAPVTLPNAETVMREGGILQQGGRVWEVNLSRDELVAQAMPLARIREALVADRPAMATSQVAESIDLGSWLAWALLVLLLVETFVARPQRATSGHPVATANG